jgi:hypothetical protein
MIAVNVIGAFTSLSLLLHPPAAQAQEVEQECRDTARMAISGALRVIGDSGYVTNREILRQLGCRHMPRIKHQICTELVQKASNIGTQGIPGYQNIRDLMKDMGC